MQIRGIPIIDIMETFPYPYKIVLSGVVLDQINDKIHDE